jgi:chemotaxis protein histidine kinase CheA
MALAEKYVILFQKECTSLSKTVLKNLENLAKNPQDHQALENMLQAADTIIGDSRFINHKELEQASMLLVKVFNDIEDVSQKSKEIEFFSKIFTKTINR